MQSTKNWPFVQTAPEKTKNSKKIFSGPISATFEPNLGPYGHQFSTTKRYF